MRQTRRIVNLRARGWLRIDGGHYARRLECGRNLVVRKLEPKVWVDTYGEKHETMSAAIEASEVDLRP